MKKIILIPIFLLLIHIHPLYSQSEADTSVYLLTCGPGTETYSIYGHSALRISVPYDRIEDVYNWGVFDFSTPNFAWKFAKGRLEYMLNKESLQSFLRTYIYEQRFVYYQEINLSSAEKRELLILINDNLKPENRKYRYDFFYDDCSTRIRDLLEKVIGRNLLYPPDETVNDPTFRDVLGKYQGPFPWLQFGIDLIMGSGGDRKTSFRDRMFLPLDMQKEMANLRINREGKMIPLLQNPVALLDFEAPSISKNLFTSPVFIFTMILIIIIILSGLMKSGKVNKIFDIIVFSIFSVLSVMMIFFNFFTDHQQMKWNLNILWLNPLIIICLLLIIMNKTKPVLHRILFYITAGFVLLHPILPQGFNSAVLPLALILLLRSSIRAGLNWNPFSLK